MTNKNFDWKAGLAFDKNSLWHPYTSMINPLPTFPVDSAHGVYIQLASGEKLIDGMASWWSAIHGYNNQVLNQAVIDQLAKMSHVMFGGLTHQPAIELGQKLVELSPSNLSKVFLADSGSVSVEVAIKMATQFWFAQGKGTKNRLLSLKGGYHGDTAACMSVCDPEGGMHEMFTAILPKQIFAPRPVCKFHDNFEEQSITEFKHLIEAHHQELAAVILEPIVQGAGGMYFYSPEYLKKVSQLCKEFDVLLILDEIATGFGRAGKLFACEYADIQPDIMCVGKALTGGYMSLAATLTTEKVAHTISNAGSGSGALMHGPTFMANPLACACALASLNLLIANDWKKQVQGIEAILMSELSNCESLDAVEEVRVLGAIGVVEMKKEVNMEKIQKAFVEQGIWLRPFGKLVYMMPPYVISETELRELCSGLATVLSKPENYL
jgi:adenosylmethionine-8-amino-7-oxononanoate aminotransferase